MPAPKRASPDRFGRAGFVSLNSSPANNFNAWSSLALMLARSIFAKPVMISPDYWLYQQAQPARTGRSPLHIFSQYVYDDNIQHDFLDEDHGL